MPINKRDVFPYYDDTYLEKTRLVPPLALAARVLLIAEYHEATAREHSHGGDRDDVAWVLYGISEASSKLAQHGEFDALGLMYAGLEALVPADVRAKWPLSDAKEPTPRRRRKSPQMTLVEQQLQEIVENGEQEG